MADEDYSKQLEAIPTVRREPPRWMTFAGCGCLVPGFLLVIIGWFGLKMLNERITQNLAWESLARIVDFDESARGTSTGVDDDPNTPLDESREPGDFVLVFGGTVPMSGGIEVYWFGRDVRGPTEPEGKLGENAMLAAFVKIKSGQSDAATQAPAGTPIHEDMTIDVQGRTLRGRRIPEMISDDLIIRFSGLGEVRGAGAVVWLREDFLDPDHEDETFDLLIHFQRPGSSQPILDDDIRGFLAPFDIAGLEQKVLGEQSPPPSPEEGSEPSEDTSEDDDR